MCKPLNTVPTGEYNIKTCDTSENRFLTICYLQCKQGYEIRPKLQGISSSYPRHCLVTGVWDGVSVTCIGNSVRCDFFFFSNFLLVFKNSPKCYGKVSRTLKKNYCLF